MKITKEKSENFGSVFMRSGMMTAHYVTSVNRGKTKLLKLLTKTIALSGESSFSQISRKLIQMP